MDLEYDLYVGGLLLDFPWLYLEESEIVLETATTDLVDIPFTITLSSKVQIAVFLFHNDEYR